MCYVTPLTNCWHHSIWANQNMWLMGCSSLVHNVLPRSFHELAGALATLVPDLASDLEGGSACGIVASMLVGLAGRCGHSTQQRAGGLWSGFSFGGHVLWHCAAARTASRFSDMAVGQNQWDPILVGR